MNHTNHCKSFIYSDDVTVEVFESRAEGIRSILMTK